MTAHSTPDWSLLSAFGWVAAATAVLLIGTAYVAWESEGSLSLFRPLLQEKDWKFTDSFASKITLGANVIVLVLGNKDVLTDILGKNANAIIALSTVTAAISAGLVAGAPVVLAIFAKRSQNRLIGILLAALLTIAGTGGQLAVLTIAVASLNPGGAAPVIAIAGIAAGILLIAYTIKALGDVIADSDKETSKVRGTRATIL